MVSSGSGVRSGQVIPSSRSGEYSARGTAGQAGRPRLRARRATRAKRRFPARSTRPSRAAASRSRSRTGSPSTVTPPPGDQAARLAARRDPEATRPGGPAGGPSPARHDDLGDVVRRPVVADDPVEVLLGRARPAPGAVEAVGERAAPGGACRPPGGRPAAARRERGAGTTPRSSASGMLIVRPNCSSGGVGDADLVAERLAHLLLAVEPGEDRHRHHDLRRLAVAGLDLAAEHQVEELVGAADLDVGLAPDRVVGLHQRVEQLEHRDRAVVADALGEVVAPQELVDRRAAGEARRRPRAPCPRTTRRWAASRCAPGRGSGRPARGRCRRCARSPRRSASAASSCARTDRRPGPSSRR